MNTVSKARQFAALHVKGAPVRLYNAWDAGSARAVVRAGAKAVATSSWAVAAGLGYADGEDTPLPLVHGVVGRVVASVDVPVSVDFEGGYSEDEAGLAENITRLLGFRAAADPAGVPLFINARTDLFLGRGAADPKDSVAEAIERAAAYAAAGASGFFVPGLKDAALIGRICEGVELPVNVMMMDGVPSAAELSGLGVARVSWGAIPYAEAMAGVERAATAVFG
jgi:2-methylisocitrate lyase-like PEP mutase family enzyme